jgi:hypothetical protein
MPIGLVLVLTFLLSLFWVVEPVNWRELIIFALACTSSMVVFALERGNTDIVIFIMLVVAGVLSTGPLAKRILSYALMLLARLCQTARNRDPGSAWKRDPSPAFGQACPGSEQEGPTRGA